MNNLQILDKSGLPFVERNAGGMLNFLSLLKFSFSFDSLLDVSLTCGSLEFNLAEEPQPHQSKESLYLCLCLGLLSQVYHLSTMVPSKEKQAFQELVLSLKNYSRPVFGDEQNLLELRYTHLSL